MSFPIDRQFPLITEKAYSTEEEYNQNLIEVLEEMNTDIANNINGFISASNSDTSSQWIPTIEGTTAAGSTTYSSQKGICINVGSMVYAWFDVEWSATTATGNLILRTPYVAFDSINIRFPSPVYSGNNFSYDASRPNLYFSVYPNTSEAHLMQSGRATTITEVPVSSPGRLVGQLMYIGALNG